LPSAEIALPPGPSLKVNPKISIFFAFLYHPICNYLYGTCMVGKIWLEKPGNELLFDFTRLSHARQYLTKFDILP
jgi:hypothetical protein